MVTAYSIQYLHNTKANEAAEQAVFCMSKTVKEVLKSPKPDKYKVRVNENGKYSHYFKLSKPTGDSHGKRR